MTLEEFFEKLVLPALGETPDAADSYEEENIVGVTNSVLSRCLEINNRMLKKAGKAEVGTAWYSMGAELPFDERLLKECCCYGAAWRLIIDDADTDMNKIELLRQEYERALEKFGKIYMATVVRWFDYD